jgi:prolyl-tRNA synthetase
MVMIHGDDKGLVMPPRVSRIQVVLVPCGITVKTSDEDRKAIEGACQDVCNELLNAKIRAHVDLRENYSPGYKFNHWELRVWIFRYQ